MQIPSPRKLICRVPEDFLNNFLLQCAKPAKLLYTMPMKNFSDMSSPNIARRRTSHIEPGKSCA